MSTKTITINYNENCWRYAIHASCDNLINTFNALKTAEVDFSKENLLNADKIKANKNYLWLDYFEKFLR